MHLKQMQFGSDIFAQRLMGLRVPFCLHVLLAEEEAPWRRPSGTSPLSVLHCVRVSSPVHRIRRKAIHGYFLLAAYLPLPEHIGTSEVCTFVNRKTPDADEEPRGLSDEIRLHIQTIVRHLRGLGLTEQQIELHLTPLKRRHGPNRPRRNGRPSVIEAHFIPHPRKGASWT